MATLNMPSTATLVANTAQTVTVAGAWPRLHILPTVALQVTYIRGDGETAVVGADYNYLAPPSPAEPTCVPTRATDDTTVISMISATAGRVGVSFCDCDD